MDFIERIFHIAPDGGNGLTESAFLFTVLCGCIVVLVRALATRTHRHS